MTSTRLPGKILKPILGRPALSLMLERLKRVPGLAALVVATTTNTDDDPVEALARREGVGVFRGSELDVLDRVVRAARAFKAEVICEATSDCIVIDPAVIRRCIDAYLNSPVDYAANVLERTYPVGMDTQVYAADLLARVDEIVTDAENREHVSLYIYRHPEKYKLLNVAAPPEAVWPELHLTLDTADDYLMLKALYEGLYPSRPAFTVADIVDFLKKHPEIAVFNGRVARKKSASEYFAEVKTHDDQSRK